jgi:hypothetical protein
MVEIFDLIWLSGVLVQCHGHYLCIMDIKGHGSLSTQFLEKPMKWWTTMVSPFFLSRLAPKHSPDFTRSCGFSGPFLECKLGFQFWNTHTRPGDWDWQVSHHPPMSSGHAENSHFSYDVTSKLRTKFLGNSVDIYPVGRCDCVFLSFVALTTLQNTFFTCWWLILLCRLLFH